MGSPVRELVGRELFLSDEIIAVTVHANSGQEKRSPRRLLCLRARGQRDRGTCAIKHMSSPCGKPRCSAGAGEDRYPLSIETRQRRGCCSGRKENESRRGKVAMKVARVEGKPAVEGLGGGGGGGGSGGGGGGGGGGEGVWGGGRGGGGGVGGAGAGGGGGGRGGGGGGNKTKQNTHTNTKKTKKQKKHKKKTS